MEARHMLYWEAMQRIEGVQERERNHLEAIQAIAYGASRFNASATAMSKEQSRAVGNHQFPWEQTKIHEGISVHQKIGSFIRREEKRHGRT